MGWTRGLFRLLKWTVLAVVGFWDMKAVAVQSIDDIDGDGHPRNVFTPRSGRTEDKFHYPSTLISELASICCLPALQSAEFTHQWSEASCSKSLTSIPAMITDSNGLPLCRSVGAAAGFNGDDEIDLPLSH
ncbi:hypothetical protein DER46DRAFT_568454 [Fusarium sp. MPI-SDFR-AT-0072]|nr:hypothetical protein DER46DRAFT_568454 [Fusarium sp. MPI-SDFR-AT-0072]